MIKAKCPSCSFKIDLGQKIYIGKQIVCPECEAVLEVIEKNPPLLDWVYDYSVEDYENEDYFDESSNDR